MSCMLYQTRIIAVHVFLSLDSLETAKWGQVIVRHIASLCVTAGKS